MHDSFDNENRCCSNPFVPKGLGWDGWKSCWDCICDEKALAYSDYTDAVLDNLDKLRQLQIDEPFKWERVMELEKESARYNFPLCLLCENQDQGQAEYYSCDEALSDSEYFSEEDELDISTPFRPEPLGMNVGISPADFNNNASSRVFVTRKLDLNTPSK